jgi:hypothetical protein
MDRRKLLALASVATFLTGCVGGTLGNVASQQDTAAVQNFLQVAATTRITALGKAYNDFAAATPQQTHGMACVGSLPDSTKSIDNVGMTNLGTGILSVWAAVQREIAANPPGNGLSAEEVVAKASIYQPASAQFNWAVTQVESGCVAYLHDINQSVNSTAGLFTSSALSGIIAGAPVGM